MANPLNATYTGLALETNGLVSAYNDGSSDISLQGLALLSFGFLTPDSQIWVDCNSVVTSWMNC